MAVLLEVLRILAVALDPVRTGRQIPAGQSRGLVGQKGQAPSEKISRERDTAESKGEFLSMTR
jgi:hypothetical protein